MLLKTIPKDYIINMSYTDHGRTESNFLLHGLSIKNDSDKSILLSDITFELYSSKELIKQISYREKALELAVSRFNDNCGWLGEGFGAGLFLGEEGFFHPKDYSSELILKANQETGIFNEYFVIVHTEILDKLVVCVTYKLEEKDYREELSLPLIQYKNKNDYIFPLKGCYSTCGNHSYLLDHRQHYSMEFAIDMVQLNGDFKNVYKENMNQDEYKIFGNDVLAIADGEVMDCFNEYPVTSSWVWEEREQLLKEYGFYASQCGNYVSIKHADGEYSFYGHMILGSVTVQKGDRVKQGQVIGKVGHTGVSGCPHLHFQLMDGPDFLTARGLPCYFTNLSDYNGNPVGLIQENNLIVHTI